MIYAMLTKQGTAAKETAVCTECIVAELADKGCIVPVPDDVEDETVVDCTGNDELECIFCGKKGENM